MEYLKRNQHLQVKLFIQQNCEIKMKKLDGSNYFEIFLFFVHNYWKKGSFAN